MAANVDIAGAFPREAWGTRGGWIIAIVIGVAFAAMVGLLVSDGTATPPTALSRDVTRYDAFELPEALGDVLGRGGRADGQAYRDLATAFLGDGRVRVPLEELADPQAGAREPQPNLPLLADLIAAGAPRPTPIFAETPEVLVNHDRELRELRALETIGGAAVRQASLYAARGRREDRAADYDRARELYEAAFSLGQSLATERIVFREFQAGYRLMGDAINGLGALAKVQGDAPRVATLAEAGAALTTLVRDDVVPLWDAIGAPDTQLATDTRAREHIGDVLAIARDDAADPMWRTSALLRLGPAKFTSPRRADRGLAALTARQVAAAADDGPIQLAAEASRDLDEDGARMAR